MGVVEDEGRNNTEKMTQVVNHCELTYFLLESQKRHQGPIALPFLSAEAVPGYSN